MNEHKKMDEPPDNERKSNRKNKMSLSSPSSFLNLLSSLAVPEVESIMPAAKKVWNDVLVEVELPVVLQRARKNYAGRLYTNRSDSRTSQVNMAKLFLFKSPSWSTRLLMEAHYFDPQKTSLHHRFPSSDQACIWLKKSPPGSRHVGTIQLRP